MRRNQGQEEAKTEMRPRQRGGKGREGLKWRGGDGGEETKNKRMLRLKRSQGLDEAKAKKRARPKG